MTITKEVIHQALIFIDEHGFPIKNKSKEYVIDYNNRQYPVKYVIGLSKMISEGIQLNPDIEVDTGWLNGGEEANSIIRELGFTIIILSELEDNLIKKKKDYLDWVKKENQGKWSPDIPKANWLSGYWDFPERNKPIQIMPIKKLLLQINGLSELEKEQINGLPENIFTLETLEKFQVAKEKINSMIKKYPKEVNLLIASCNQFDKETDTGWRGWEYSNFKRTKWVGSYEKFLKKEEGEQNMSNVNGWNRILYGPPGTGKTYSISEIKNSLIEGQTTSSKASLSLENFSWREAIFLAFKHNKYQPMRIKEIELADIMKEYSKTKKSKTPYGTISTTIIEHATVESTNSTYRRGTDYFKRCDDENSIKWELTEEGINEADELEMVLSNEEVPDADFYYSLVTFHQSYSYEDFIEGIYAETIEGQINYEVKDGIFKKFCDRAKDHPNDNFLFVIDEINRGNISKIFGELITLIEESKRLGNLEELKVKLPYSGTNFGVPKNVFILGTMNTADRSISMMDTALRRRFEFIEKMPDVAIVREEVGVIEGIDIAAILEVMNQRIEYFYDREHSLGHAFFLNVETLSDLQSVFENKIIPLLQEYFFEDYQKIQAILNDTKGIYIKRSHLNPNVLFDSAFTDLVSDFDNSRFALKTSVNEDAFLLFINAILAQEN